MPVRLATLEDLPIANREIEAASRVAVDTEFHAERRYIPRLYLVQVRVPSGTTWLFDPMVEGIIDGISVQLRETPWIVHGGFHDIRLLNRALGGVPSQILDTQIGAGLVTRTYPGAYGDLLRRFMDVVIDKSATLSDWSRRPLSDAQIEYASNDVQLLTSLWDRIAAELEQLGRGRLAVQACSDARNRALNPEDASKAWRNIAGSVVLNAQQAAVLQELASWRELTARTQDQPVRTIMGDGMLVELARRQPISRDAMAENRRVSKNMLKRYAEDLVEVIQRVVKRSDTSWPQIVPNGSAASRRVAWLSCFALLDANQFGYAARLALPKMLLQDMAVNKSASRSDLQNLIGDWRYELLGDRLWQALNGGLSLRLTQDDAEHASH